MKKKHSLGLAIAAALGGGSIALAALPAAAQQAQKIEKIEVTGSNIKRVEGEGPSAIVVMTRDDIEKSGVTNVYDLLGMVAANQSIGQVSVNNVVGALTFSANTASLRGLGGGRTLVLLNGKRLNTFAGELNGVQGVNLNTIPFSAIERVEILLDGASAVYGSDAIAGVINFIMRKDYRGAEVTAYYGAPTRGGGGGEEQTYKGSIGFGDLAKDRYNVFIAASYNKQDPLEQRARSFSNRAFIPEIGYNTTSGQTFPGFISTAGIGNPGFPNCAPSTDYGTGRCLYDPARQPGVNGIPESELKNVFASATFNFTPNLQGYVTGNWSDSEIRNVIQPVPISDAFGVPILLPATSPFYPHDLAAAHGVDGQPLNVRYRAVENGNRDSTDTNKQWQIVGGLKGNVGRWDWDASVTQNEGTTDQVLNGGYPLNSLIQPLLSSGRVNLFGPNTPQITDEIRATNYIGPTYSATAKATLLEAKMSGEAFTLPAGPLGIAFGATKGKEELDQNPAPVLATGDLSGFGGNLLPLSRDRDTWAAYLEANIPLVRSLEANIAIRHDDYSDFGGTTNPKYSLRWQPTNSMLVRASYGTGFLAPSLFQLYNQNTTGVTQAGLVDPLRCPITGDALDCAGQFPVVFGGNATLKPEESKQTSIGIVLEPMAGVSFSADWFDLKLSETVTTGIAPGAILNDLTQYGYLVTRAPGTPGLPGLITQIDQRFINLGKVHIQGIDASATYTAPPTPVGRFRLSMNGTYMLKYDVEQLDGSFVGFVSNSLFSPVNGVTPRFKSYQAIDWDSGPWGVHLGNSYQSSYTDVQLDQNGNERTVSSMSLWDLQVRWKAWKGLMLSAGARNLLDTNPPLTNQNNTFQAGYDPGYYDARGRVVYVQATYAFR
jgi:iron complex outermembrane receptor protein